MKRLLFLISLMFLMGCGGSAASVQDLTFTATDGAVHHATWYPAADGDPAVLLLHMLNSDRTVWADFAAELNTAGYSALAVDLRGHGDSGGTADWTAAPNDVHEAWNLMVRQKGVDINKTAIVGASIGANLALVEGANESRVRTVVLMSPSLDYRGVKTESAMSAFGDRPVLIINSSDDTDVVMQGFTLNNLAQHEDSKASQLMEAGHGTNMLTNNPGTSGLIIEWLDGRFIE